MVTVLVRNALVRGAITLSPAFVTASALDGMRVQRRLTAPARARGDLHVRREGGVVAQRTVAIRRLATCPPRLAVLFVRGKDAVVIRRIPVERLADASQIALAFDRARRVPRLFDGRQQ